MGIQARIWLDVGDLSPIWCCNIGIGDHEFMFEDQTSRHGAEDPFLWLFVASLYQPRRNTVNRFLNTLY